METGLQKGESFNAFEVGFLEYLLVVSPDAAVYDKVMQVKQDFDDEYEEKIAVKSKPQIVIATFIARERMEETIIKWIQRICGLRNGFDVMLNNYSGFPNNKTIYIRVQDHKPFKRLAKDLGVIDEYVQSNDCPKARIIDKPHLTIARRLPAEVYEKAMMDYSQKIFHDFFPVRQLVLLRRDNEFGKYKTVNVFSLLPPDPNADGHQMNLFN